MIIKKECTRLLIAFENLNYKQENAIHIAKKCNHWLWT